MNWYKISKERIPGGRAEGKDPNKYDSKEMNIGIGVEKEHSSNIDIRKEISRDHLEEFSNYYTRLKEMEEKLKKDKK